MSLTRLEREAIKTLVWDLETAVTGLHEIRGHVGPLVDCQSPLCQSLLKSEKHPVVAAVMGKLCA